MIVLPFEAEHYEEMSDLGGQHLMTDADGVRELEQGGVGFSGFIDGEIVGCAGVIKIHEHRGIAWAILRSRFRRHFMTIHRAVHRFLWHQCQMVRVEAQVDVDYEPGHRWVRALGFEPEGPAMPYYLPGGRDAIQYARFREKMNGTSRSGIDWRGGLGSRGDPAGERASSRS